MFHVVMMGKFEEKFCKLMLSLIFLMWLVSIFPALGGHISLSALLGYILGLIYVRDSYGRYHYVTDGRFVTSEEDFCLTCILPILGIAIPAIITWYSLPLYALNQLLIVTFGSEFIGIFGGFGFLE